MFSKLSDDHVGWLIVNPPPSVYCKLSITFLVRYFQSRSPIPSGYLERLTCPSFIDSGEPEEKKEPIEHICKAEIPKLWCYAFGHGIQSIGIAILSTVSIPEINPFTTG